jgi:hypothetical protein
LPDPDAQGRLVREASGRPGWIHTCVELQAQGHYRQGEQLFVSALCADTENALHRQALSMIEHADLDLPDD